MPEPISDQIVTRATATLSAITRANGYPMTAKVSRMGERGNPAGSPNYDVEIVVDASPPIWRPNIAPITRDGYEMDIRFVAFPKSPDSDSVPIDRLLSRVYASIYKAWAGDFQFNYLAMNSELGKPAEVQRSEQVGTIIPCTVWFYTDRDDPFNQT